MCFYFIRTSIPTSNIWHMTSFLICKIGLTMPTKKQVLMFVHHFQDQMLKDSCFICQNSSNMLFYFRYFAENCWNIVVINCLFKARIKISVTYRDFENGRVNRFVVAVKNISCLWRKPNVILNLTFFPKFGIFLYSVSIRNMVR